MNTFRGQTLKEQEITWSGFEISITGGANQSRELQKFTFCGAGRKGILPFYGAIIMLIPHKVVSVMSTKSKKFQSAERKVAAAFGVATSMQHHHHHHYFAGGAIKRGGNVF